MALGLRQRFEYYYHQEDSPQYLRDGRELAYHHSCAFSVACKEGEEAGRKGGGVRVIGRVIVPPSLNKCMVSGDAVLQSYIVHHYMINHNSCISTRI